jgi:site-specific DNA-cytosine methylase
MRAIELFPCAGGMAEGFRRAGITFDLAFDFSADACRSYEANLGHRPICMDVRELLKLARAGVAFTSPIDLLIADPPCTPWSRAGKRQGLDDEADMLADTCELIALLRPTAWLIGNVPGLDDSTNAGAVGKTIGELSRSYAVDYAKLNASSYGVPQHRVRPFWFGRPLSSEPIRWPAPTHGAPGNLAIPGTELKPWVTCRDALSRLPIEQLGRPVRVQWKRDTDHKTATATAPAPTQTTNTHGDGALLELPCLRASDREHDRHPPSRPDEPALTQSASDGGGVKSSVLVWPWDVPATTVTADERLPPPGHHPESGSVLSVLSVPNAVVLSERARAILQGFPECWKFLGDTKKSRSAMIGMAMPPPMAEAVARSIVAWFATAAVGNRSAAE